MSTASAKAWRLANPSASAAHGRASYLRNREQRRKTKQVSQAKARVKRRTAVDDIKSASGCVDCGYNVDPCTLDFDHVRGTKSFGISFNIMAHSWAEVLIEMAKCDIVCANCHRLRTHRHRHADSCVALSKLG